MDGGNSSAKAVISAILGNTIITVAKGIGWFFSGSPSMLAESIHSLADTANQILLYIGIRHGSRGPSRNFPMGQGRARYVWNLISAIGIFFIGFGVTGYHGVQSLLSTERGDIDVSWWTIAILVFSLLVEGYVFLVALKIVNKERRGLPLFEYLKQSDDPTTIGVLFEDGIAVFGVLLALGGIYISKLTGSHVGDSIASILIACLMGIMAIGLAYTNGKFLIGAAAPAADETEIREFIEEQEMVERVITMNTAVLGPGQLRLSIEIEFHGGHFIDRDQLIRDAEKIKSGIEEPLPMLVDVAERTVRIMGNEINRLERLLREKFPSLVAIELEVN